MPNGQSDPYLDAARKALQDPFIAAARAALAHRRETTKLGPADEELFRAWARRSGVTDVDVAPYDYRGWWKESGGISAPLMKFGEEHFPDTWKQHGHPTFSVESRYARPGDPTAGSWRGETFIPGRSRRPAPFVERQPEAYQTREGQKGLAELAPSGARGLAESGYATAIGLATLAPGKRAEDVESALRRSREAMRLFYGEPETGSGALAMGATRLVGDVAQFAVPGTALAKISKPASVAGRVAQAVGAGAVPDVAMAASDPESSLAGLGAELTGSERLKRISESPVGRAAFEVGVTAPLVGVAEAVTAGRGLLKVAREAKRAAARQRVNVLRNQPRPGVGRLAQAEQAIRPVTPAPDLERPTFQRRGQPQPPERVVETPSGERVIPPPTAPEVPRRPVAPEKMTDDVLASKIAEVEERLQRDAGLAGQGSWTREDYNIGAVRSGRTMSAAYAGGRATQSGKYLDRLMGEAQRRKLPPELLDRAREGFYERAGMEMGGASPAIIQALAGGALGGTAGAATGETPGERIGRAVAFGAAGAGAAAAGRALFRTRPGLTEADLEAFVRTGPKVKPPVNADDWVNASKFGLDRAGEDRLKAEVVRIVQQRELAPKQVVRWGETEVQAKQVVRSLGLDPRALVHRPGRLRGPELLAVRNLVRRNIVGIQEITKEWERAIDPLRKAELEGALAHIDQQNDALLSRFVKERSATGRDLNNLKIIARQTTDPMVWMVKAKQAIGDAALGLDVQAEIRRLAAAGDPEALARYVARLKRSPLSDQLVAVWKAGLLTNPKTHIVNTTSNLTMASLEIAKDNPALVFDYLLSKATGLRTKAPTSRAMLAAAARGAKQGVSEAGQIMRNAILRGELPVEQLSKLDLYRQTNINNVLLDRYTKGVFGALSAEDRIFRLSALQRAMAEQAELQAAREGVKGAAQRARVAQILQAPSDELAADAILMAEHSAAQAVFQDPTALGGLVRGIQRLPVVGQLVAPFARTPGAVATRVLEYSPLGAVGGTIDAVRVWRAATKGLDRLMIGGRSVPLGVAQRQAVEKLGRSATGLPFIWLGMVLYENGRATAGLPKEPSQRNVFFAEGKQPNAVLVDGKWENVGRLSPAGNLIALGAHMGEFLAGKPEATALERLAQTGAGAMRIVADQPFVTGIRQLEEATQTPLESAGELVTNTAASAVPAVVAGVARSTDPIVRQRETLAETVKGRLPGASKTVPSRIDILGEEMTRERGIIANLFHPGSPRRATTDPVVKELARVGAGIATLRKLGPEEPMPQYRERQVIYGHTLKRELERAMRDATYQRLRQAEQQARRAGKRQQADYFEALEREWLERVTVQTRAALTRIVREGQ